MKFVYFSVILKSTLDEFNRSDTFVVGQINGLLDDACKINNLINESNFSNDYNRIGKTFFSIKIVFTSSIHQPLPSAI